MKNLASLSLKLWLPLLVLILFIGLLASATWQAYRVAKLTLIESSTNFIRQDMFSLQQEITREFFKSDMSHAKTVLSSRGVNPSYNQLVLIDANNKIMLSTDFSLIDSKAKSLKRLDREILRNVQNDLKAKIVVQAEKKIITAYFPISLSLNSNEIRPSSVGVLFLIYSLVDSENAVWQKVLQTVIPIGFSLFIAMFILIIFLNRFILRPILYLKTLTESFSNKNVLDNIELKGTSEFRELSREFNKMILKRRLYEYNLERSNKKLSKTLSELAEQKYALDQHSLVVVTDTDGTINNVNDKFCLVSGYSESELIGENHRLLSSHTHSKEFFKLMYQTITNGSVWHGEICNKSKNGDLYWLDTTIVPFMGEDKKPQSYVAIRTDITHRKIVLQKLAESEQNLLLAQKTAQLGHFSFNIRSSVWNCSKELEYIFGIDSDYKKDFSGWINIIHPEEQEIMDQHLKQHVMTEHKRLDKEYRIVDLSTHREKWVHCIGKLKFDSDNQPIEIFGTIQDITHRKHVEIALQRAKKMEAIGQLTGGIAHDFNNILGIIIGNLDLLEKQFPSDEKAQKRILSASKGALRAANLTKQLLGFSQVKTIESKVSNANNLIKNIDDVIAHSMGQQIDVCYTLEPDLWSIKIDRGELQDALLNLLLNARHAMNSDGEINIETSNKRLNTDFCNNHNDAIPGDYVQISVTDTGEGIVKDKIASIFEPFYTTKLQGEGSGLGLAMVFGFVKRSGGFIQVDSELDIGTSFKIYLPRSKVLPEKIESDILPDKNQLSWHGGNESLLIVDDEEALLELAKLTLQELGYQIQTANNAQQALDILSQNSKIDLVFSDVIMQGKISGFDLAEKIQTEYPNINILLTSGYTGKEQRKNGKLTPEFEILTKPYSQQVMSRLIRNILDAQKTVSESEFSNSKSEVKIT